MVQWPLNVMITSLLLQNDVATSFWSNNNVISTSCIRWGCILHIAYNSKQQILWYLRTSQLSAWVYDHKFIRTEWCVYVSVRKTTIPSDNGVSPARRQDIIWTNAGSSMTEILGSNFCEIGIKINKQEFKFENFVCKTDAIVTTSVVTVIAHTWPDVYLYRKTKTI